MTNFNSQPNQRLTEELVQLLTDYFARRGPFLAQVIRADLQTLPYLVNPTVTKNGKAKTDQSIPVPIQVVPPQVIAPPEPSRLSPPLDIPSKLVELVVQQTGFPKESVTLEARLLDDLNLDSIKGGELVASLAKECNVAGQVDPATLANASLREIVEAVRAVMPSPQKASQPIAAAPPSPAESVSQLLLGIVAQRTGFPLASLSLNLRLLDDLNLDSIKTAELIAEVAQSVGLQGQIDPANFANATLAEVAASLQKLAQHHQKPQELPQPLQPSPVAESSDPANPWVRNFVVEYLPEAAPPLTFANQDENWETANLFEVDDWRTAKVGIIADAEESDWVAALRDAFAALGVRVSTATFNEIEGDRHRLGSTHYIAILPRTPKGEMSSEARVRRAMQRLYTVATLPSDAPEKRPYQTIAYLQFGGGYFGRLAQVSDLEQSCTMGFAASLHLERAALKVRTIDLPLEVNPQLLVTQVIEELARPEAYVAVGYDAQLTRRVPRPRIQETALYQPRNLTWSVDDVFLVTGGAKGITAECALALTRMTGVRMALVGSSPHPQDNPIAPGSTEIAQTLERFSKEGLTCRYYQCDVTDSRAVSTLIGRVQSDLGQITGVIHGSALNKPRRVENATLEEARNEVAPKVLGILNLIQALEANPPKLLVGFSSISAVLGLPGNTWYGFSNEALDLILRRFEEEHPETSVLAIAFSVWSEVGMGARMGTVRNLNRMGIEAMPTEEGVRRFLQLLETDPGDRQVVVSARLGGIDTLRRGFDTWRTKRISPPANFKFLEQVQIMEPGVEVVVRTHLSFERDSYVQDHIYKGSYLFPTVFGLEAMAQAVAYATGRPSFESVRLEDIRLERPIVVDPQKGVDIEIRAQVIERASATELPQVRAEIRTERTGYAMPHFAATFILDTDPEAPSESVEMAEVPLPLDPKTDLYGWLLFQGQRFQRIEKVYNLNSKRFVFRTQMEGVMEVAWATSDRSFGPFLLGDPYYRDSLLQAVQPVIPQDTCLPVGIDRLQIYALDRRHSGSYIGSVILHGRHKPQQYISTVCGVDGNGQILDKLEGYRLQILERRDDYPTAEELADPSQRDEQILEQHLSRLAEIFKVSVPSTSLTYLSGLHSLSAAERHQQELPLFARTVGQLLNANASHRED